MDKNKASKELDILYKELEIHNKFYFEMSSPIISDRDFDEIQNRIKFIERKFPDLKRNYKNKKNIIGFNPSNIFKKVQHKIPILSLENITEERQLSDFMIKIRNILKIPQDNILETMAELKIDGLTASIHYNNGSLFLGATRGNGLIGEDVTENIRMITDIPKSLPIDLIPQELEVRGEIYITKEDFDIINQQRKNSGDPIFVSPRNAASGSVRQINPIITEGRRLKFFAYSFESPFKDRFASTQLEVLKMLELWGFSVCSYSQLCKNELDMLSFYKKVKDDRLSLNFDIDGVVFKINSLNYQKKLGFSGKAPRYSIAYKFPSQQLETLILDIINQVGRTGSITPVAILQPVYFNGVKISRATLHNYDELVRKDIRINDIVIIERSGDVIPKVINVVHSLRTLKTSKALNPPEICPSCGTKLIKNSNLVILKCNNNWDCPKQAIERLTHFCSRNGFNIVGFGENHIEKLYNKNIIKTPADIFSLEKNNYKLNLEEYDGWGKKSVENLFDSINRSRSIELERFIYSLGIPHIGIMMSKALAEYFNCLDTLLIWLKKISLKNDNSFLYEINNINGIGSNTVQDLIDFFCQEINQCILNELSLQVTVLNYKKDSLSLNTHKLLNKRIALTGSLLNQTRKEVENSLMRSGAIISNNISKKVNLVVVGKNASSKKIELIKNLKIPVITELELEELIKND